LVEWLDHLRLALIAWVLEQEPEAEAKENVPTAKPNITEHKKHDES
jgi:hypothetical protein